MTNSRLLLRVIAAAFLFAGLTGTAPGNIGGCNADNLSIGFEEHCERVAVAFCNREFRAGRRLDGTPCDLSTQVGEAECATDLAACTQMRQSLCPGGSFVPNSCRPPRASSDACVERLGRNDFERTANDIFGNDPACDLCP